MSSLRYCLPLVLVCSLLQLNGQKINWMTWEEAVVANQAHPKKIFVDVYTDWCGWCRKMDSTTFIDSAVVSRLNADFYAIKLNAEQKESIFWKDKEYKWIAHKRDGVNQLAYDLLNGQLSYPAYVYMDSDFARKLVSPGYKIPIVIMKELKFVAEEHYKTTTWQEYKSKS